MDMCYSFNLWGGVVTLLDVVITLFGFLTLVYVIYLYMFINKLFLLHLKMYHFIIKEYISISIRKYKGLSQLFE